MRRSVVQIGGEVEMSLFRNGRGRSFPQVGEGDGTKGVVVRLVIVLPELGKLVSEARKRGVRFEVGGRGWGVECGGGWDSCRTWAAWSSGGGGRWWPWRWRPVRRVEMVCFRSSPR